MRKERLTNSYRKLFRRIRLMALAVVFSEVALCQCPPNIDFEAANFNGWQCYTGSFTGGNLLLNPSSPVAAQHKMLTAVPGNGLDFWGGFPKNCPNGSGHSIQLGNAQSSSGAERVSYTFTIPPSQNVFSIIYSYAVVLQDFGHPPELQPRLKIEVKDLTTNAPVPCSSLDFVVDENLPGFLTSTESTSASPVRYKNWSSQSVNLDNMAGRTIQISFTTTDCGQTAHFGYAYIDIDTDCSSSFLGSVYCADDTVVTITAPYGYQAYKWMNSTNQVIGQQQVLTIKPPPPPGTVVSVELTPYDGYGCVQTLSAVLSNTLTLSADAGPDGKTCNNKPIQLGSLTQPGLKYKWTPATGLSNPDIANPVLTPAVAATSSLVYTVTVTNAGGGCATTDDVNVDVMVLSDSVEVIGNLAFCEGTGQSAILKLLPADSVQWFRNGVAIPGTNQLQLTVSQTGDYYAMLYAAGGCSVQSKTKHLDVYKADFNISDTAQCEKNNSFIFTNSSVSSSGNASYVWDFGDGNSAFTKDASHSYLLPGKFAVKLSMTTPACQDDSVFTVTVYPSPVADFVTNGLNQCFPGHQYILTNNSSINNGAMQYLWSFGDGTTDNTVNPVHTYAIHGNYTIKLLVDAAGGCKDSTSRNIEIYKVPDADFSVQSVCQDLRVPVINRTTNISQSTVNYFWDFGNGHLDNTYTPAYTYTTPGAYTITLRVSTAQCPASFNSISKNVVIERVIPGITYPDKDAAFNYAEQLQARNIGTKVIWTPATSLSNRYSFNPVFKGITPELYTVQLTTAAGCVTIDTQLVKTHKKIEIYVPTGFTPGNDNLNERLRPVLIGFVKVNYFRVYNRWGKLLFSMNSDQPGWDGKINGNPVDMQTVVWMIEAVDVDGKVHNQEGTTIIIR